MSPRVLVIDAGAAVVAAILLIVVSPGLAVVGLVSLLVLVAIAASYALERLRSRAGNGRPRARRH